MLRRAGDLPAALRAVCHLFSAAVAAGFLFLPFLSTSARAAFTGDFSQVGGAVYDSGNFDELNKVVLSTASGTPYVYAVGYMTSADEDWLIVKYNALGVMVASRTVHESTADRAYDAALDSSGNLYVVGEVAPGAASSALYKFDANLVFLASASIAGSARAVGVKKAGTERAFTLSFNANQVFLNRYVASVLLGGSGTEQRVVTSYINTVYDARPRFAINDSAGEVIFELGFSTGTSAADVRNRFEIYKWNGEVADISAAAPLAMATVGFDVRHYKGNDIVRAPDGLLYAVGFATVGASIESVLVAYDPSSGLSLQSTAAVSGVPKLWSVGVDTVTGHVLAACYTDTYRFRYDGIGNLFQLSASNAGGGRSMAVAGSSQVYVGGDLSGNFVTKRLNMNGPVLVSTTGVTRTWNGHNGDTLASTPGNWDYDQPPQPGDSIKFGTSPTNITMDLGIAVASTTLMPNFTSTITITAGFENLLDFYASTGAMGAVHFGSNEIKFGGDIDISSSVVFYMDSSTLTFNGAGNQSMRRRGGTAPIEAGNQLIQKPAGTRITMGSDAVLLGNFTMVSGTFSTTYNAVFKGDMRQQGGYFDVPSATAVFSGTVPQTMQVTGGMGTPFKAVQVSNPTAFTVDAPMTTALFQVLIGSVVVSFHPHIGTPPYYDLQIGTFTVDASGYAAPAVLRSMSQGSMWRLVGVSSHTLKNVHVEDSDASAVEALSVQNGRDGGGNRNWVFFSTAGSFGAGITLGRLGARANEFVRRVRVDPVTGDVYALAHSTFAQLGSQPSDLFLARFNSAGVLLASRTFSGGTYGDGADVDSSGNLYIGVENPGSTAAVYKLSPALAVLSTVAIPSWESASITTILATGSYVYAAGNGLTTGTGVEREAKVYRFDSALTPMGMRSYYAGAGQSRALGLAVSDGGDVYLLATDDVYSERRVARFSAGLDMLLGQNFPAFSGNPLGADIQALGNGIFVASYNTDGTSVTVSKLDSNLNLLGNKFTVANASVTAAGVPFAQLSRDAGDLYLSASVTGPAAALYRLTPTLLQISSVQFGGSFGAIDLAAAPSGGQLVYGAGAVMSGGQSEGVVFSRTLPGTAPVATALGFTGMAATRYSNPGIYAAYARDNLLLRYDPVMPPITAPGSAMTQYSVLAPKALAFTYNSDLWVTASTATGAAYNTAVVRFQDNGGGSVMTTTSAVLTAGVRDPSAIAIQPATGDLWVANRGPVGSPSGASVVHFFNANTFPSSAFSNANMSTFTTAAYVWRPGGLAFDTGGNLWVTSPSSGTLRRFAGNSGTISASQISTYTAVAKPYALAFHPVSGHMYVSDTDPDGALGNGKLWVFPNLGTLGSPSISTTPILLQSGLDIVSMDFKGNDPNIYLYGSDLASDSIVMLSTAVPQAPQLYGAISGRVDYGGLYSGVPSGKRYVVIVSSSWPSFDSAMFYYGVTGSVEGTFELGGLQAPATYFAYAILDIDGAAAQPDPFEPVGYYRYSVQQSTGLEARPIYVAANSTTTGVAIALEDVFLASVTVSNASVQTGDIQVEYWQGLPVAGKSLRKMGDEWAGQYWQSSVTKFIYIATRSAATPYYFRAYMDSNHNYSYDDGEDISLSSGPIAELTAGATYPIALSIAQSAGGTLYVSTRNLAPAILPSNAWDVPLMRLGVRAEGGNAQWSSLFVSLLGDAPPMNVQARVYKDVNGDGEFQPASDSQIGSVYFGGYPPTANVMFWSTQTLTSTTQYFFLGTSFWSVSPGKEIAFEIESADRFGLSYGAIAAQPELYPLASLPSRVQMSLFARPTDGGYSEPGSNPSPWGGFDSGLYLQPGQNVRILAAGTWGTGDYAATGPDGVTGVFGGMDPGIKIGALIGRIGSGPWFFVGSSATVSATQSGSLVLAMNDYAAMYGNNFGSLSIDLAVVASTVTRVWLGNSGIGPNASYSSNWQGGQSPLPGEAVRFDGAVSTAPCLWDIYGANVGVLTLLPSYTGVVEVGSPSNGYLNLQVSSNVALLGGTLRVRSQTELGVDGRLDVDGGTLELLGDNSRLRLSRKGLLARGGAFLRATGTMWSSIQSAGMDRFPFIVDNATVDFRNSGGLELSNAEPVDFSSRTYVANFDDVRFYDWATTPMRATPALHLHAVAPVNRVFRRLQFGWGFPKNVDASSVTAGSTIDMRDSQGERRGSPYEVDPNGVVAWNPDGGGAAQISGTIALSGSPVDDYTVLATTSPEPNGGETISFATQLSAVGAYSLNNLQAPNTYYVFAWRGPSWARPEGHTARGGWLHAGLARSEPVFVANGANLSNIDITLSAWGGVNGWVNNNTSQFGPIRVQPWIGAFNTPDVSTRSLSTQLSSWGGSYEFGAPAGVDQVLAFVDVNGNGLADPFEAQSTVPVSAVVAGSTRVAANMDLSGGGVAPGGFLSLTTAAVHPGAMALGGSNPLVRLDLYNASSSSAAIFSALKFDLVHGDPQRMQMVELWRDVNGNGQIDPYMPAGAAPGMENSDSMVGSVSFTPSADVSTAALTFWNPQTIPAGETRRFLLSLSFMAGTGGTFPQPVGLSVSATYFTLAQGTMASQPALYPVQTGLLPVRFSVNAMENAGYNGPNSGGMDTGLQLEPGLQVTVTATGTWLMNYASTPTGPGGFSATQNQGVSPNANIGELIARVGGWDWGSNWVRIGTGTTFASDWSGRLFLAANDYAGDYYNNSGRLLVSFSVSGSTTGGINGEVFYPGGVTSGNLNVRAFQAWMYPPQYTTTTVPMAGGTPVAGGRVFSFELPGLDPGWYKLEAEVGANIAQKASTPREFQVLVNSTANVKLAVALGQASIAGTLSYPSTGYAQYGDFHVLASTHPDMRGEAAFVGQLSQAASGAYTLSGLPAPATYYLVGYRGWSNSPNATEPTGMHGVSTASFAEMSAQALSGVPAPAFPVYVDTGSFNSVTGKDITLFDRGAVSGQVTRHASVPIDKALIVVAGHGFPGRPGYRPESQSILYPMPAMTAGMSQWYQIGLLRPATDYSVFIFLDANGNSSYDVGELFGQTDALAAVAEGGYASADVYIQGAVPPGAVANFRGTPQSGTVLRWTWDGVPNAVGYKLVSSTGGAIFRVDGAEFYDETLTPNTTSQVVRVRAYNAQGDGPLSDPLPVLATLANAPGTASELFTGASSAAFSWGANANSILTPTRYEVSRASAATSTVFSVLAITTATAVLDQSVAPGRVYQYRIQAVNYNSVRSSTYTAYALTTLGASGPSAAGQIAYAGAQGGSVLVQAFTTSTYAGAPASVSTLPAAGLMPYYLGLSAGTTYWIRAFVDADGNGQRGAGEDYGQYVTSVAVAGVPVAGRDFSLFVDTMPPASPAGLSASASIGRVNLTWNAPTRNANNTAIVDLAGYRVQRASGTTLPFITITTATVFGATGTVASTGFTDYTAEAGRTHYYRVLAFDYGQNQSLPSGVVAAAPTLGGTVSGDLLAVTVSTYGVYRVRLSTSPDVGGAFVRETALTPFTFAGLPDGSYYLRGFRDLNDDRQQDSASEPSGTYGGISAPFPLQIANSNRISSVTVTVCDRTPIAPNSQVSGAIAFTDCVALDQGPNYFTDIYTFRVGGGLAGSVGLNTDVEIRLDSGGNPNRLFLLGPNGNVVAQDNRAGGAYIRHTVTQAGIYRVEPTSYDSWMAFPYTLRFNVVGGYNASIGGTLAYSGSRPGLFYAQVFTSPESSAFPVRVATFSATGAYSVGGLPDGIYYLRGFRDANSNGVRDRGEPAGVYGVSDSSPTAIRIVGGIVSPATVDLTVYDPVTGRLAGQIVREGSASGTIRVSVGTYSCPTCTRDYNVLTSTSMSAAGPYAVDFIAPATNYVVKAFLDTNGSGDLDGLEPAVSSSPVTVSPNSTTTLNLLLRDLGTGAAGNSSLQCAVSFAISTGPIFIGISADSNFEYIPYMLTLSSPSVFVKTGVLGGTTYYLGAFVDHNGNASPDEALGEPQGSLRTNAFPEGMPVYVPASSAVVISTPIYLEAAPTGSIFGQITYNGSAALSYPLRVEAWNPYGQGGQWSTGRAVLTRSAGQTVYSYRVDILPAATTYSVKAWVDSNGNNRIDYGEPYGQYGQSYCAGSGPCYGTFVAVSSGPNTFPTYGINMEVRDPGGYGTSFSNTGKIKGSVVYLGVQGGPVYVRLFDNSTLTGAPVRTQTLYGSSGPGDFEFEFNDLPFGTTFYLDAFRDPTGMGYYNPAFHPYTAVGSAVLSQTRNSVGVWGGILTDRGAGGSVNAYGGTLPAGSGGVRFDGGATDLAIQVLVDSGTAGGPYAYALGTTLQNAGTAISLAKFGPTGTFLSSRTLSFDLSGVMYRMALDDAGTLWLAHGGPEGDRGAILEKLDSGLRTLTQVRLSSGTNGSGDGVTGMAYANGCLYLALGSYGNNAPLLKVDRTSLLAVATGYFEFPGYQGQPGWSNAAGVAADEAGNVYALVTRNDQQGQGVLAAVVKHGPNLGAALSYRDVSYFGSLARDSGELAVGPGPSVFISYIDRDSASIQRRIRKLDSALNETASASISPIYDHFGSDGFQSLVIDSSGSLYVGYEATTNAGDIAVARYDGNLNLLASRTFDGKDNTLEDIGTAVGVAGSTNVYLFGTVNNGQNLDWVLLRMDLNASGSVSAAGSAGTGVLRDTVSGAVRYAGTTASSGTVRAMLFPLGTSAPIRSSTAAFAAQTNYLFNNVPMGNYVVRAFVDQNSNYILEQGEPAGQIASGGFYFPGGSLSGTDVSVCDRPMVVVGTETAGSFSASDCLSAERPGAYQKLYTFRGERGQTIGIDLTATGFYDSYLVLFDPDGNSLTSDDDGGGTGNARISNFVLPKDGLYMIAASPFSSGITGAFTLKVAGSSGGGALGSISGSISSNGSQGAKIKAAVFTSPDFSDASFVRGADLPGPGAYSFAELKTGATYYVAAFSDVNYNDNPDPGEDFGTFGVAYGIPDPIYLRSGQAFTGADFTLAASTFFAVSQAGITGVISYAGTLQGELRVELWSDARFQGSPIAVRSVPTGVGPYDIAVPGGQPYYVRAYLDVNRNFVMDGDEPRGVYQPYNQGAAQVFTPVNGMVPGVDFPIQDAFVAAGGAYPSGEGVGTVPSTVYAGSLTPGVTVQLRVGANGIASSAGLAVFGVPMGWAFPQWGAPGWPGFVAVTGDNVAGADPTLQLSSVPSMGSMIGAVQVRVISSTPLYAGATVQFVYHNFWAPCYAQDNTFRIGTASSGTLTGTAPMPLIAGEPSVPFTPGAPQYFMLRNGWFSVMQGQVSDRQYLESRDNCGNLAPVTSLTTATLRARRYDMTAGRFIDEGALRFSTTATGQYDGTLELPFAVGRSSRAFVVRSTATGDVSIEISSGSMIFFAGLNVVATNTLTNVSIATAPYVLGIASATIIPNGDPASPNQAYVNFDLGSPNMNWTVLVASVPFKGEILPDPIWQAWGYGQPSRGQVSWDGRYSPWINNGARVPTGGYYVRVEVGAGVRDDSLTVRVITPQLAGQVFDDGTNPKVPLSDASLNLYGPFGGQTVRTDSRGAFTLPGLAAGDYQLYAARDGYLSGNGSIRLDNASQVSTFTAYSADVSLATTSAGALNVFMNRASTLLVTPVISTNPAKPLQELWGGMQLHTSSYTRSFFTSLHLPAGTTTFDDGGQWDPSVQRFVTKTLLRFDVPSDTYTVRANLPGFDETVATGIFVARGLTALTLPAFGRQLHVGGTVYLPAGSNPLGTFVSVNAIPLSTTTQLNQGFGGAWLPANVESASYDMGGLQPGQYRMLANTRGFSAQLIPQIGFGAVDISTADFTFSSVNDNVISGTVTVVGNTSGFPTLESGHQMELHVNAWAPGSMNFGQAEINLSGGVASSSAVFHLTGLDPGIEYQVWAWLEQRGQTDFDVPGGMPKRVTISAAAHKNPEASLAFSYEASSGVIQGVIFLPTGQVDFGNVAMEGETVASVRTDRVGEKFATPSATMLPGFVCGNGAAPAGGNCAAGVNTASFTVTGMNTETVEVVFNYKTTGMTRKTRVSVVNGSTTQAVVDLRNPTYSISGVINDQIQSSTFNTTEKIALNAALVPLRAHDGSLFPVAGLPIYASTASLARVVALARDFTNYTAAVTTTASPVTDRVGFIMSGGTFTIAGVPPGTYFVRTANLRVCPTCDVVSPLTGQMVTVTSYNVTGVTITVRDGYSVSGAVSLAGDILDARTLRLSLYNQRQELVRTTTTALGNTGTGSTANSVDYTFRNLSPGDFYTLVVEDVADAPKYAGRPIKFPDPALSPKGLTTDLTRQNLSLLRAAYLTGKLKDANTGEQINRNNAAMLAPNFKIAASANPWIEGGYVLAAASVSARPIRYDGTFLVGPLIPDVTYDLKAAQDRWDLAFLAQGSQNYAPVTVAGLKPGPGETKDVGTLGLNQGQSVRGRVVDAVSTTTALGNIKVLAKPSFGTNGITVQSFTNGAGEYTVWVSTFVSQQYDLTFAPRDGNVASSGKVYREQTIYNFNVSTTSPPTMTLTELLGQVTGQVLTADGGALSYPFGERKGFPAAALFLQPANVIPKSNPLGDIEVQTDSYGAFSILGLSTGAYTLRAVSLGYGVLNANVSVATGSFCISTAAASACTTQLALSRGAVVTGRILLPSGSAPSEDQVGGIAAANRGFTEFVIGAVEMDPIARTVSGYTISGFKPGVVYNLVITPKEGKELSFPSEGQNISFAAAEAQTTKSINLTYGQARPDCEADARVSTITAAGRQFQVKIVCSQPLRNQIATDNDLDALLTVSTANSLGVALVSPDGTGQMLGGDKRIGDNRKVLTALYRAAAGETRFSLKLEAVAQTVDQTTGRNYTVSKVFDFYTGLESARKERVSNIQGGNVRLEPTEEDLALGRDERFRADFEPGTFETDSEYQQGLGAGATTQFTLELRRARSRQAASAAYVKRMGFAPSYLSVLESPRAMPVELYRAMASTGINPMSAFYDVFLPLGIRSQLKKPVELTFSYDLSASTSAKESDVNVWYYNPAQGRYIMEANNRRLDTVNKTVTVSVDHFSTFVVLASTPIYSSLTPYTGGDIKVFNFPNPADCIRHTKALNDLAAANPTVSFDGTMIHYDLPAGETSDLKIKIYDVAGELVREIPQGQLVGGVTYYSPWDCKNDGGKTVASGVYIGQLKWGSKNKFFKMAIIKGSGL